MWKLCFDGFVLWTQWHPCTVHLVHQEIIHLKNLPPNGKILLYFSIKGSVNAHMKLVSFSTSNEVKNHWWRQNWCSIYTSKQQNNNKKSAVHVCSIVKNQCWGRWLQQQQQIVGLEIVWIFTVWCWWETSPPPPHCRQSGGWHSSWRLQLSLCSVAAHSNQILVRDSGVSSGRNQVVHPYEMGLS